MMWRNKLEKRLGWLRIPNLMNLIVGGMALVWLCDLLLPALRLSGLISLNMAQVARGQIWRLLTFVFVPPSGSVLTLALGLYFYWMIGSALEGRWGAGRFTRYYAVGMLGAALAACITGYGSNAFLNLSMFFAFAALWPDFQVMLFFILPVKIKYLALLDAALYVWQLIVGGWPTRLAIVFSLLNLILFMGGDLLRTLRQESHYWKTRRNFRSAMRK